MSAAETMPGRNRWADLVLLFLTLLSPAFIGSLNLEQLSANQRAALDIAAAACSIGSADSAAKVAAYDAAAAALTEKSPERQSLHDFIELREMMVEFNLCLRTQVQRKYELRTTAAAAIPGTAPASTTKHKPPDDSKTPPAAATNSPKAVGDTDVSLSSLISSTAPAEPGDEGYVPNLAKIARIVTIAACNMKSELSQTPKAAEYCLIVKSITEADSTLDGQEKTDLESQVVDMLKDLLLELQKISGSFAIQKGVMQAVISKEISNEHQAIQQAIKDGALWGCSINLLEGFVKMIFCEAFFAAVTSGISLTKSTVLSFVDKWIPTVHLPNWIFGIKYAFCLKDFILARISAYKRMAKNILKPTPEMDELQQMLSTTVNATAVIRVLREKVTAMSPASVNMTHILELIDDLGGAEALVSLGMLMRAIPAVKNIPGLGYILVITKTHLSSSKNATTNGTNVEQPKKELSLWKKIASKTIKAILVVGGIKFTICDLLWKPIRKAGHKLWQLKGDELWNDMKNSAKSNEKFAGLKEFFDAVDKTNVRSTNSSAPLAPMASLNQGDVAAAAAA